MRGRIGWVVAAATIVAVLATIGIGSARVASNRAAEPTRSEDGTVAVPSASVPPTRPGAPRLVDVRTGERTLMPESITSLFAFDLSVSEDGTRLAFAGTDRQIYVANRDGTGVRPLAKLGEALVSDPNWPPDGTRVVFVADDRIHVAVVATGAVTPLTPDVGTAWNPNFSPDGRTVIFTAAKGRAGWEWLSLWSVPGGRATTLMKRAAMGTFSPDGKTIAFMEIALPGDGHVWMNSCFLLANADGTHRRGLVGSARNGRCHGGGELWTWTYERPDWSPDATRIAYENDGQIQVVRVATGTATTVTRGLHPTWTDDHELIVESHAWRA